MADKDGNKTGGRVKGTPNKSTQHIHEMARELGVDPMRVLLLTIRGDRRDLGYPDRVEEKRKDHELGRKAYEEEMAQKKSLKGGKPYPEFPEYTEEEILQENLLPLSDRLDAVESITPYMYAKRKPVDSEGNDKSSALEDIVNEIDEARSRRSQKA